MGRIRHYRSGIKTSRKLNLGTNNSKAKYLNRDRPRIQNPIQKKQKPQPVIHTPFSPNERILLFGEADLSFARSLIEYHGCAQIIATVYESEEELREKYPHVDENIKAIENNQGIVRYNIDATNIKPWMISGNKRARRMETSWMMDRIIFNFPHVGGKSKDVNRQVRYNQELLVSFFKQVIPCLSPFHGSSIIVTLFDGEPYTLWNIRDLARHCDLEVSRSFDFSFSAYPGYKHCRTLGVIKRKNGEIGGGWKGEERSARSYVFVRKGEGESMGAKLDRKEESSEEHDE